jgi:hypothetical protein
VSTMIWRFRPVIFGIVPDWAKSADLKLTL